MTINQVMSREQIETIIKEMEESEIYKLFATPAGWNFKDGTYRYSIGELFGMSPAGLQEIRRSMAEELTKTKVDLDNSIPGTTDEALVGKITGLEAKLNFIDRLWNYRVAKALQRKAFEDQVTIEDLRRNAAIMAIQDMYKEQFQGKDLDTVLKELRDMNVIN